jgi:hypothetical protein
MRGLYTETAPASCNGLKRHIARLTMRVPSPPFFAVSRSSGDRLVWSAQFGGRNEIKTIVRACEVLGAGAGPKGPRGER